MNAIKFRIWDSKHNRWFHGKTDEQSRNLRTDAINLFGEVIIMGEIMHDQNEDDVWRNDPDVSSSIDAMQYLIPLQFTGMRDRDGDDVYDGDIVAVVTERVSSSHSTWYQRTNEHHGEVSLNMIVSWDEAEFRWTLKLCRAEDRLALMEPMGNERTRQQVHVPYSPTDRNCVVKGKIIGNIYENPELLKQGSEK